MEIGIKCFLNYFSEKMCFIEAVFSEFINIIQHYKAQNYYDYIENNRI